MRQDGSALIRAEHCKLSDPYRDIFEPLGKAASVGAHIDRFVEGAAKRAAVENRGITVFDFKPQVEALLSVAAK